MYVPLLHLHRHLVLHFNAEFLKYHHGVPNNTIFSRENENWMNAIVVVVDIVPIRSESSCDIYRIDKIPSN